MIVCFNTYAINLIFFVTFFIRHLFSFIFAKICSFVSCLLEETRRLSAIHKYFVLHWLHFVAFNLPKSLWFTTVPRQYAPSETFFHFIISEIIYVYWRISNSVVDTVRIFTPSEGVLAEVLRRPGDARFNTELVLQD